MNEEHQMKQAPFRRLRIVAGRRLSQVPIVGWLLALLVGVVMEQWIGYDLVDLLDMYKVPSLFGILAIAKEVKFFLWQAWDQILMIGRFFGEGEAQFILSLPDPFRTPRVLIYLFLVYLIPIALFATVLVRPANWLAARLSALPTGVSVVLHLGLLYLTKNSKDLQKLTAV